MKYKSDYIKRAESDYKVAVARGLSLSFDEFLYIYESGYITAMAFLKSKLIG